MIFRVLFIVFFGLLTVLNAPAASMADSLINPLARLFGADSTPGSAFLPPDEAFPPPLMEVQSPNRLVIRWRIAEGYSLYRSRFRFTLTGEQGGNRGISQGVKLGHPEIPPGTQKDEGDETGPVAVFRGDVAIGLPIIFEDPPPPTSTSLAPRSPRPIVHEIVILDIAVGYQGCAEAGFCYQPITKNLRVELPLP